MEPDLNFYVWTLAYVLVVLGLSAYGIHRYFIIYLYERHKRDPHQPKAEFVNLPRVTVQLPLYNELYVVERLLNAVSELDYPRDKLEIQVLDDSTDETRDLSHRCVEKLKARGFDIVHLHRADRTGFKAGALDAGLRRANGELIFILDADFVPDPDILQKTVHYFTDPAIGMIQTRWGHINRGYSLLTRVQAMFLDGHLLLEQTARSRSGRFFNFNGTAGLWRRECIAQAGGWEHDTLTEDLDLSYRAQLKGWKFLFLPDLVTPAELPVDMNGFKSQQHRWTKGSVQTCKKILPRIWRSDFPLWIKLEATIHLTSNFAYLLLVCLCVLIHPSFSKLDPGLWRTLLFDIPVFAAASISVGIFYWYCQKELNPKSWRREIIYMPLLLALGIGLSINNAKAVLEAVFNHKTDFTRTPKYGIEQQKKDWKATRYAPIKSMVPLVEMAFAGYFTFFTVYAIQTAQWTTLPFIILFQVGFTYVAFGSIRHWIQRRANSPKSPTPPSDGSNGGPSAVVPA
jgi:cellulose synthase/poly-beta-1,6-N-acetylglucosamine synthase-like glycosyltransferase